MLPIGGAASAPIASRVTLTRVALWWQAYSGGSYDGFEEAGFTFAGTLVLTPFLAFFTPRLKSVRRRLPRSSSDA